LIRSHQIGDKGMKSLNDILKNNKSITEIDLEGKIKILKKSIIFLL
jgi:hypothetical protein